VWNQGAHVWQEAWGAEERQMQRSLQLRQAVARVIGAAFAAGAASISGQKITAVVQQRGNAVEHRAVLLTLEALELLSCVRLAKTYQENVVTDIYPDLADFL
jgi:hypothetical protein